jgi:hypothetical protein
VTVILLITLQLLFAVINGFSLFLQYVAFMQNGEPIHIVLGTLSAFFMCFSLAAALRLANTQE